MQGVGTSLPAGRERVAHSLGSDLVSSGLRVAGAEGWRGCCVFGGDAKRHGARARTAVFQLPAGTLQYRSGLMAIDLP